MKTKNFDDDTIINKGLTMALEFNTQAKEEWLNWVRENAREDWLLVGNVELLCGKESLAKAVAEVIKTKDSGVHSEEYMKHKCDEK